MSRFFQDLSCEKQDKLRLKRDLPRFLLAHGSITLLFRRLALQHLYPMISISGVDMICILTSDACVRVSCVYYKNVFLHLHVQAGNFLGLLVGRLCMDLTRCKNFFPLRRGAVLSTLADK